MDTSQLIAALQRDRLTYLSQLRLESIVRQIGAVKSSAVPGHFVEFGIALGGSGILIASQADLGRSYIGFDVFAMIPPPTGKDGPDVHTRYETIKNGQSRGLGGTEYYGYRKNLYDEVAGNFACHGLPVDGDRIILHRGPFEQTIDRLGDGPVAFAHIDCDWYKPSLFCLTEVAWRMPPGGIIIVDDFMDWSGSRRACLQFLLDDERFVPLVVTPHLVLRHGKPRP